MTDALINVNGSSVQTLEILFMLTVITLLPSILMLITAFTRIIIVLSFLRNAIGLQGTPPNSVLIGLALFMTLFIMSPVMDEVNETAYQPYRNEEISQVEALQRASVPIKRFMFIPFLLIDIVVSSTLMSMGMIMLPPATISLPFKILLFVTVNGWQLLFSTLVYSFN